MDIFLVILTSGGKIRIVHWKIWLLQRGYIHKVSGGCAKLVQIGYRSTLNWSTIASVLVSHPARERVTDRKSSQLQDLHRAKAHPGVLVK